MEDEARDTKEHLQRIVNETMRDVIKRLGKPFIKRLNVHRSVDRYPILSAKVCVGMAERLEAKKIANVKDQALAEEVAGNMQAHERWGSQIKPRMKRLCRRSGGQEVTIQVILRTCAKTTVNQEGSPTGTASPRLILNQRKSRIKPVPANHAADVKRGFTAFDIAMLKRERISPD